MVDFEGLATHLHKSMKKYMDYRIREARDDTPEQIVSTVTSFYIVLSLYLHVSLCLCRSRTSNISIVTFTSNKR